MDSGVTAMQHGSSTDLKLFINQSVSDITDESLVLLFLQQSSLSKTGLSFHRRLHSFGWLVLCFRALLAGEGAATVATVAGKNAVDRARNTKRQKVSNMILWFSQAGQHY